MYLQYRMISIKTQHESIKSLAWEGIEDRIGIGPGSNYNEGPKLGIGPGLIFRARDWIGIKILGIDPSLVFNQLRTPPAPQCSLKKVVPIPNDFLMLAKSSTKQYYYEKHCKYCIHCQTFCYKMARCVLENISRISKYIVPYTNVEILLLQIHNYLHIFVSTTLFCYQRCFGRYFQVLIVWYSPMYSHT